MRNWTTDLSTTQLVFTVRFDQGYRYLDKCGEAMVRLEDALPEGWLPGQIDPNGAVMHNFALGLEARFNVHWLNVMQGEFIAFDAFRDQACMIYDVLRSTFSIKRILTPALRVVFQIGFGSVEDAERFLINLNLCEPNADLMNQLGGTYQSASFTVCTDSPVSWQKGQANQRRRFEARVVKQERQPYFDERILLRLAHVPERHREALAKLRELRRQHPRIVDVAVQFDVENSLETDFNSSTFDLASFLRDSHEWTENTTDFLAERMSIQC